MEVSTHLPSMLAETEEPLPRWQLMTRVPFFAHDLAGAGGHEAMGRAVETVAADGVVLVVLIRNGVNVRFRRHGHAEGGVEHGDLRHAGHRRLARLDAHEVGGLCRGPSGKHFLMAASHASSTTQDSVNSMPPWRTRWPTASISAIVSTTPYSLLVSFSRTASIASFVGGERNVRFVNGLAILGLVGQTAVDADALTKTFGEQRLVLHVDELILQRRAAGVDNQNLHWFGSFP